MDETLTAVTKSSKTPHCFIFSILSSGSLLLLARLCCKLTHLYNFTSSFNSGTTNPDSFCHSNNLWYCTSHCCLCLCLNRSKWSRGVSFDSSFSIESSALVEFSSFCSVASVLSSSPSSSFSSNFSSLSSSSCFSSSLSLELLSSPFSPSSSSSSCSSSLLLSFPLLEAREFFPFGFFTKWAFLLFSVAVFYTNSVHHSWLTSCSCTEREDYRRVMLGLTQVYSLTSSFSIIAFSINSLAFSGGMLPHRASFNCFFIHAYNGPLSLAAIPMMFPWCFFLSSLSFYDITVVWLCLVMISWVYISPVSDCFLKHCVPVIQI